MAAHWFGAMISGVEAERFSLQDYAATSIAGRNPQVREGLGTLVARQAEGLDVSLGFPVGMSAGADEPTMAAPRVSVIASIGYCAFLGGPPLVGFLGSHFTVRTAILSVAVLVTLAMLITGWIRPPASSDSADDGTTLER